VIRRGRTLGQLGPLPGLCLTVQPLHPLRSQMRDYTSKEKAKITAGAVAALVIVGWLAVFALALLSAG
jgi:hypothetical protein